MPTATRLPVLNIFGMPIAVASYGVGAGMGIVAAKTTVLQLAARGARAAARRAPYSDRGPVGPGRGGVSDGGTVQYTVIPIAHDVAI